MQVFEQGDGRTAARGIVSPSEYISGSSISPYSPENLLLFFPNRGDIFILGYD